MKAIGYIVNCEMGAGGPMVLVKLSDRLWKDVPRGGVLLLDTQKVSVFPSRSAALDAIKRTESYRPHPEWPNDAYSIRRLVAIDVRSGTG